jgi:hypothetical protein
VATLSPADWTGSALPPVETLSSACPYRPRSGGEPEGRIELTVPAERPAPATGVAGPRSTPRVSSAHPRRRSGLVARCGARCPHLDRRGGGVGRGRGGGLSCCGRVDGAARSPGHSRRFGPILRRPRVGGPRPPRKLAVLGVWVERRPRTRTVPPVRKGPGRAPAPGGLIERAAVEVARQTTSPS